MSDIRYCVMIDDDGHNYLVPAYKRDDFQLWLNLTSVAELAYRLPEWARRIDDFHKISFTDPKDM